MGKIERCFIMLCKNDTEKECLERNLFGDMAWRLRFLEEIRSDDAGFLLNVSENELLGIFVARSKAQLNIEPDAWGGRFPAQVRVQLSGKAQRISNASDTLRKIGIELTSLKSGAPVPKFAVYDKEIAEKILAHFREPVPIEKKAAKREEAEPVISEKLRFENVVGLHEVKKFIKERMVDPIVDLESAQKYYLRLGGGVLLYGPPGTGKTLVAQATAGEIDAPFVELSPSIIRGFPGDPEKKIEELFQGLLSKPRAVVFLDEAEALLATRDSQTSTVMQRITPVFLAQFAKLSRQRFKPIMVMAATNMPWGVDNAFLRPGRLDKVLYVGLPDKEDRVSLLGLFLQKRAKDCVEPTLCKEECLSELSENLDHYSGADIEQILDEAAVEAFNKKKPISRAILDAVIAVWPRSVDDNQLQKYREWGKKYNRSF